MTNAQTYGVPASLSESVSYHMERVIQALKLGGHAEAAIAHAILDWAEDRVGQAAIQQTLAHEDDHD